MRHHETLWHNQTRGFLESCHKSTLFLEDALSDCLGGRYLSELMSGFPSAPAIFHGSFHALLPGVQRRSQSGRIWVLPRANVKNPCHQFSCLEKSFQILQGSKSERTNIKIHHHLLWVGWMCLGALACCPDVPWSDLSVGFVLSVGHLLQVKWKSSPTAPVAFSPLSTLFSRSHP